MLARILTLAALCWGAASAAAASKADALTFALNLECLEAEFYSWAAYGVGLNDTQRGGGPASVGGVVARLGVYADVAKELADDELAHLELLRSALDALSVPTVPCPAMDIGAPFALAADAAIYVARNATGNLTPPFSPYGDDIKFLHAALLLEDVGVMAYTGLNDSDLAGVLAVEAYHAGIVRRSLADVPDAMVAPYPATVRDFTTGIAGVLQALLGLGPDVPLSIWDGLVPGAVAYGASARQVQNVLYLGVNATEGGFFPDGMSRRTRCQLPAAASYAKCGGDGMPEMCCEAGGACKFYNKYWSGCVPPPPAERTDVVPLYEQCGGRGYAGPTACEPGSSCEAQHEYFSMCKPAKS